MKAEQESTVDYTRIRSLVKRAFSYNDAPNYRSPLNDMMTIRCAENRHPATPKRSLEERAPYQVYAKETPKPGVSKEPSGHTDNRALSIRRRIIKLGDRDQLILGFLYSAHKVDKRMLKNKIWWQAEKSGLKYENKSGQIEHIDLSSVKSDTKAKIQSMIDGLLPVYRDNIRYNRGYPEKPYQEFGIAAENWKSYRKYWLGIRNLIAEIDECALEAVDR